MGMILDELVSLVRFRAETAGLDVSKKKIDELKDKIKSSFSVLGDMRRAMLEAFAVTKIVEGARSVIGGIIGINRTFQSLQASLKTVEGSVGGAERAMGFIKRFAKETPFQVEEITQAYIKLKALGLQPTEDALRSYGNTASANNKTLMEWIEAVADAVTGENERLKEFGIKAAKDGDRVRYTFQGITTEVGNNRVEIERYLRSIGETAFGGAMADQMQTLNGAFSNLEDNAAAFALQVGEGGLNDALKEVTSSLSDMLTGSSDLAPVLGEFLGDAVRELFKLFQDLVDRMRKVKREDMRAFFHGIVKVIEFLVDKLKFLVEHWDLVLAAMTGGKILRGFQGTAEALKGIGIASASALGPIGAIVAAFVTLLPLATDLGDKLGDVASGFSDVARQQKDFENRMGGRTKERGTKRFADAAWANKINRKRAEVESLAAKIEGTDNRVARRSLGGELAVAQEELRNLQRQNAALVDEQDAKQVVLDEASARSSEFEKGFHERVFAGRTLRSEFTGKVKSDRLDDVIQKLALGQLTEAEAREILENPTKEKKKHKKEKVELTAPQHAIQARIDELVKETEMRTFLDSRDMLGEVRELEAKFAGQRRKEELQRAVSEGRLSALGGDFAAGDTNKILRDAGIIDDTAKASPPVIAVHIIKVDNIHVDAPITVHAGQVSATAHQIASEVAKVQRQVLAVEISNAIRSIDGGQRR